MAGSWQHGSLDEAYDDYPRIEEAFQHLLDQSLDPRGPDSLFGLVETLALPSRGAAIYVGCGEGQDALMLNRRFGLGVLGIDPVPCHIELATAAAATAGVVNSVSFTLGSAESLPTVDESVDLVWCKEVLMFVDLDRTFSEFARVLRSNGVGLAYQVFTGPRMSNAEAEAFWQTELGYEGAHRVRPADIEAAIDTAGLQSKQRIDFAGEWGEHAEEHAGASSRRLLHASRLLRDPDRYIAAFGQRAYRIMLGDCLWHVHRMIGNLHGAPFIFSKPHRSEATRAQADDLVARRVR